MWQLATVRQPTNSGLTSNREAANSREVAGDVDGSGGRGCRRFESAVSIASEPVEAVDVMKKHGHS